MTLKYGGTIRGGTLPLVSKINRVVVCRGDLDTQSLHGSFGPLSKDGTVGGTGIPMDNPGGGVTHFVRQCFAQARFLVQYFGAQFNDGSVVVIAAQVIVVVVRFTVIERCCGTAQRGRARWRTRS